MSKKVETAIFAKDLRVERKRYPLSKNGNKIDIVDSGEGYFMPEIGPNTFLDWPIRKKYLFFGNWVYKRIYFAIKKGAKCVDFLEGVVYGPDEEQIKKANLNLLATKLGKDSNAGVPWYIWLLLITNIMSIFGLLSLMGVFM